MDRDDVAEYRKKISNIVDNLGMPIDKGIVEAVALLRLHGIHTVGSCEGHLSRITGGPYVMFESPNARQYTEHRQAAERGSALYKRWYRKAAAANMREVNKVLILLDGFYATRQVSNRHRLIVRCFDVAVGKLMSQGADLAYMLPKPEQKKLLQRNQEEMRLFVAYLSAKLQ